MNLTERLRVAEDEVATDGLFERIQKVHLRRRKQRMVRKAVAGVAAVAAVGGTVFVIAQRKDDGHRIVTDQGTTTTSAADRISDASKFESISDADREAVTKVAETFFSSTTTAAERETLLEHGSELRATLAAPVGSPPGLPTGASGKPTVTVLGRVGNTAFADLKFAPADSSGDSSSSASAEFNFDTSGREQQSSTPEIVGLQFVRTNDRWQVSATSWCSTLDSDLMSNKPQCPIQYSALVRVFKGEARIEALDQTKGQVLEPEVFLERETAWNSENFREVAIPGGVVAYRSASDGEMANPEFPRTELIQYSNDGAETGRLRLDGMIRALTIDESVEPPVLWAHTQSGLQDQPKEELVRVPTGLSGVTARVPLDGATGLRHNPINRQPAFVPIGNSIAYVDLGFIDDTTQPAPVDLVNMDLSGNETARIRLVDQATSTSGALATSTGAPDGVVTWGETLQYFVNLGEDDGVAVSNGAQVWIVNLKTGSVISSQPFAGGISDMVYFSKLYVMTSHASEENVSSYFEPTQIDTIDLRSGERRALADLGRYSSCGPVSPIESRPGRVLVICEAPDPSRTATRWLAAPTGSHFGGSTVLVFELDVAEGMVVRTIVKTSNARTSFWLQPDPNALLYPGNDSTVVRVELPAER